MSFFLNLSLALRILVFLLLTLNTFPTCTARKIPKYVLYTGKKKERKVSLTDCKLKCVSKLVMQS